MMMLPPRCWRNRADCTPIHSVEGLPEMDEAKWDALESGAMDPVSFVCSGCVREADRAIPQDAYRLCWKNDAVDEISEYDEQDITHTVTVLVQVMAVIAARRANSGTIRVPADDSDELISVNTIQGPDVPENVLADAKVRCGHANAITS